VLHVFHITFPFEVAESHYRPGEHAPLCTHPIPLAFTITYHSPALLAGSQFVRQYYSNKLLTLDLLEAEIPEPFTFVMRLQDAPIYVFAVMIKGSTRYHRGGNDKPVTAFPGTVHFARLSANEYAIHLLEKSCRMLFITVHAAQLAVIGEDFNELASLLDAAPLTEDIISPSIQADSLLMRRLIRLISPSGINRRKDFNQHLLLHLPGVCSAIKGALHGKGQVHYDEEKLREIKAHISSSISETHRAPQPKAIADQFHITRKKLERLFQNSMQRSPSVYIHQQHMEAAGVYLTDHPDLPIYEIADIFGYNHTAAFSKAFTKHHGLSPQAYRVALQLSKTDTNC